MRSRQESRQVAVFELGPDDVSVFEDWRRTAEKKGGLSRECRAMCDKAMFFFDRYRDLGVRKYRQGGK